MMTKTTDAALPVHLRERVAQGFELLGRFPMALIQLAARFALAGVFWRSGQSKIASWEFTVQLFRDEYRVPLVSPEFAAMMATTFELACPVLLVLGLGTRLATLPLLGMAAVIQLFVYPQSWPEHLTWVALLLLLLTRGPGPISLDYLVGRFLGRKG